MKFIRSIRYNERGEKVIDFSIDRKRNKRKHMTSLKKYLNGFYWYDKTNEEFYNNKPIPMERLEYPTVYQTHFGVTPAIYLTIVDKVLPLCNYKKFEKYIISMGFDIYERGRDSFKYIHHTNKITIMGDISNEKTEVEEDEDDFNITGSMASNSDTIYISVMPTVENKLFIERFIKGANKFLLDITLDSDRFYLIAQNQQGLFIQKTKFKAIPIKDDRYDLFYGKKFPHEKIKSFISDKTDNLMLLHGDPGTGKSNYIKHIISNSKKKVIYIAPSMLGVISSPQFVTFMMTNKDSILLIEDAEEVLSVDRNSATNNLLGLTDGFLKDSLGLKVIATFNCDIGKIDPALMRKGRMFLEYKFDKLTIEECEDLAKFLNLSRPITEPMTLAEFFNEEDNHVENSFEERRIGFF